MISSRKRIAEEVGVPYYHVNVVRAHDFPVRSDGFDGIRKLADRVSGQIQLNISSAMEEELSQALKLAESENREARTFDFKKEMMSPLKSLNFKNLQVLVWEDLRKNVDAANSSNNPKTTKSSNTYTRHKRDGETLKIKN